MTHPRESEAAHVVLTSQHYRLLAGGGPSLVDVLSATPAAGEVDIPLPERNEFAQPAELG